MPVDKSRQLFLEHFKSCVTQGEPLLAVSPDDNYLLEIQGYSSKANSVVIYTSAVIRYKDNPKRYMAIKRDHPDFWFAWLTIEENMFLMCSDDLKGYSLIHLDSQNKRDYALPGQYKNMYLTQVCISQDNKKLAAVFKHLYKDERELKVFSLDFNQDFFGNEVFSIPYVFESFLGWGDESTLSGIVTQAFRREDRKPLEELSQTELDSLPESSIEYEEHYAYIEVPCLS